jgi:rhamnogalacturonyl hydrolase YesR
VLGLTQLLKARGGVGWNQTATHDYLMKWANHYEWKLCGSSQDVADPPGIQNANNQLCGATYAELYALDGKRNKTWIAATVQEFDKEIASNSTSLWSWVDALFMSMNTWSRIGTVTGEQKYFDQQWYDFSAAALEGLSSKLLSKQTPLGGSGGGGGGVLSNVLCSIEHAPNPRS